MSYLVTLSVLLFSLAAGAMDVTFGWSQSPTDGVTGYALHAQFRDGPVYTADMGTNLTATITNYVDFSRVWVTAYDADGAESDPSNSVFVRAVGTNVVPVTAFTGQVSGTISKAP